jgi:hypothetical protein
MIKCAPDARAIRSVGDDAPDGSAGPTDGGGDESGGSDSGGGDAGGADTGTDTGPFDPVGETTVRDAHPVTPTTPAIATTTTDRNRIPL